MSKFNFEYCSSLKRIKCIYTFNDEVSEKTCWEGYIVTDNLDGTLEIEGLEQDGMNLKDKNGDPQFRYILGHRAISSFNKSLIFEVYPGKMCPIHYNMRYNEEDGCFYGDWRFIPYSSEHPCVYNNYESRQGKAIIRIEDVLTDECNLIDNYLLPLSGEYQVEYADEIEYFFERADDRFISYDPDISPAVMKLSPYSKKIKEEEK